MCLRQLSTLNLNIINYFRFYSRALLMKIQEELDLDSIYSVSIAYSPA